MPSKIAIVSNFYTEEEAEHGVPFARDSGKVFRELFSDAGIDPSKLPISSAFRLVPPSGDADSLFGSKRDGGVDLSLPAFSKGKYLRQEYSSQIVALHNGLQSLRPNITILLGALAQWAVTGNPSLAKARGTASLALDALKVISTYHPSDFFKNFSAYSTAIFDLQKAKRESEFPELRRPKRTLYLEPSLEDIRRFADDYIRPASACAFDIETARGEITCISFAPSIEVAIVIPFVDPRRSTGRYWPTASAEVSAWLLVKEILSWPVKFTGQNVLYDVQWLWKKYGIPVPHLTHDVMLLHHALQPEAKKSLAYLGSLYTNEIAWKPMRPRGKNEEKGDDLEHD